MRELFPLVLLAGGLATRLHPVTQRIPKSLILVKGEPFICHQLRWLADQGVRKIVMCVGFLGDQIQAVIGNGQAYNLQIEYIADGEQLQGTGGAIQQALSSLPQHFFVLYGDSYLDVDFFAVQKHFDTTQKHGLMTVFHNQGRWDTSNIEFDGEQIVAYDKINRTERMRYIDYGLGILSQAAFSSANLQAPFDLAILYQRLLQQNQLAAFEVHQRFYEVGSFAGIQELEYHLSR